MLECRSLSVTYGPIHALRAVDLDTASGDIVAIMGESGSGKSTLLRVVAGLVVPAAGSVTWNGIDITAEPAHLRRFGLMFQDYALFPHLSVGDNVSFGLRMQGRPASEQDTIVRRMLDLVGLAGYSSRSVAELSGGEQQRVALARTLAPEPDLVLLDEPLGALDRARRDQLLSDMQQIFAGLGVTALYVTHDHHEAFAIADRVVVLDGGRKIAAGSAPELWSNPQRSAVATLLGFPVLRDIEVNGGVASIAGRELAVNVSNGTHHLAVLPGAVTVSPTGSLPVEVRAHRFEDGRTQALVDLDGTEMTAAAPHGVTLGPAAVDIDTGAVVVVLD